MDHLMCVNPPTLALPSSNIANLPSSPGNKDFIAWLSPSLKSAIRGKDGRTSLEVHVRDPEGREQ